MEGEFSRVGRSSVSFHPVLAVAGCEGDAFGAYSLHSASIQTSGSASCAGGLEASDGDCDPSVLSRQMQQWDGALAGLERLEHDEPLGGDRAITPKMKPRVDAAITSLVLVLFSHGPRLVLTPKACLASHKSLCTSREFLLVAKIKVDITW